MVIREDHVAIYIRWSTEDQGDGTTLGVQRDGCMHYVLSQGWQVSAGLIFVDDGYSGGTLKRPAITKLREQVRQGLVDCVVVYKLDRLSRSVLDTVNLVLEEWDEHCFVKSAREPIDTTTPAGKLFFYMLLSYAEWERSVIKERTFSGRVRRASEGRIAGSHPYGYRVGARAGSLAIVPDEAAVVRRIFAAYDGGQGVLCICRALNAEGVPAPRGGCWHRSTLRNILANPLYRGEYVFLRRRVNPRRARNPQEPCRLPNPDVIRVRAAAVEPIIDTALWERVQVRAGARHRTQTAPRALDSRHLLTGLLRCACGAALTGARARGADYYVCARVRDGGSTACDAGWIRQGDLDAAVLQRLLVRYGPSDLLPFVRQLLAEAAGAPAGDEVGALRQRRKTLAADVVRLDRVFRQGELRPDLYQENRQELQREQAALAARIERAEALAQRAPVALQQLARRLGQLDPWAPLQRPEQKAVLRGLLVQVLAYRRRSDQLLTVQLGWRAAAGHTQPSSP